MSPESVPSRGGPSKDPVPWEVDSTFTCEDGDEGRLTLSSNGPNDDGDEDESRDMFDFFVLYLYQVIMFKVQQEYGKITNMRTWKKNMKVNKQACRQKVAAREIQLTKQF